MRANEKQFQSLVGKMLACLGHGLRFVGKLLEKRFRILPNLIVSSGVNQTIARHAQ